MPALTRGSLPARVYWVRRLMLLGTAVLLVIAIARLLGDGSDGSSADKGGEAARLAAEVSTSPVTSQAADSGTPTATLEAPPSSTAPVLAAPVRDCVGSDIAVLPKVEQAVAGRNVMIVLQVRSTTVEACTWRVSPDSLAISITSGKDRIWSSRDCPRVVPRQEVVAREAVTTNVGVVWKQAKRSDDSCSSRAGWALPGWYHVTAAALGGEPSDVQFELTAPVAATVTKTATPKQRPKQGAKQRAKHAPSGAVEPSSTPR